MAKDLLHPSSSDEKRKHKLKRLIQSPNSFFMDVKCPGCFHITTVFSHAQVRSNNPIFIFLPWRPVSLLFFSPFLFFPHQTVVLCAGCATILSKPTGGKCRLTEGCSFRKKVD